MRHIYLTLTLCLASFLVPCLSSAAIVVALDDASLTHRVDTVAFGSVLKTKVEIGKRGGIVTKARLQIVKALKGAQVGQVIDIVVPGGVLPSGRASAVAGSPVLETGNMVVGFLEARPSYQVPWGLAFGLLRVSGDAARGFRVDRDVRGLSLVDEVGQQVSAESVAIEDESLEALWSRLEAYTQQSLESLPRGEGQVR